MCGINGIVSWQREPASIVSAMNRHLVHRGPDGDGVFTEGPIAFGHVRLSILDLTNAGAQPMSFGRWVLIFNGEIYNFHELRDELSGRGYEFVSRSDTEVLLKAWDCWGMQCLSRLNGMFAFALLDRDDKRIHLCRDSYGVKPLFYSLRQGELLFSSELSTLTSVQQSLPAVDRDAVATFLALHYVPAPQTGLQELNKLPAGHYLVVSYADGELRIEEPTAWHQPFLPRDDFKGITLEELDRTLAHSVRQQMVSDVPVGAFLSGGVDSSLICHYASQVHREPLHTFSIGLVDAGSEYDETAYAAQAAKVVGAQHHAVQVELASLSDHIDGILDKMGELNADTSVFLNHIVCAEARKFVKVGLSGAGGDEMFGGYYRHQAFLVLQALRHLPLIITQTLSKGLGLLPQNRDSRVGNLARRLVHLFKLCDEPIDFVALLRHDHAFPQESNFFKQPLQQSLLHALAFDFRHFLGDNILSFSDKMSMLHGLEVRVPFLAPEVVRLAQQMGNSQRVTLMEKKILLKQLAARYFPRNLIYRPKQGFAAPLEVWLRRLPRKELQHRCLDGIARDFVPEGLVVSLIDNFLVEKKDLSLQLYSFIMMNRWQKGIGSSHETVRK